MEMDEAVRERRLHALLGRNVRSPSFGKHDRIEMHVRVEDRIEHWYASCVEDAAPPNLVQVIESYRSCCNDTQEYTERLLPVHLLVNELLSHALDRQRIRSDADLLRTFHRDQVARCRFPTYTFV